ncbi:MAG TPA: T9SS type A sorting domain-containing protein, partial [Pontibacter sp.]
PGVNYYRLKQVDFDGEYAYSRIIQVRNEVGAAGNSAVVYPNPFAADLNIRLLSEQSGEAVIQVVDMQGRVLFTETIVLNAGTTEAVLPLRHLSKGVYILKVEGSGLRVSEKLLKL